METVIARDQRTAGAIDRLARYFGQTPTRQGVLARQALGQPSPADDHVRHRLVGGLRAETRMDGSVGGMFVPTVTRAMELLDLGYRGDEAGAARVVGWILSRQGKPGAFGEGCTPSRHQQRLCEHALSGFFSAGAPSEEIAPLTLPNGKVFRAEAAARFAASCFALRVVLRAGHEARPLVDAHVASLVRLHDQWSDWTGYFSPDMIVSALHALAVSAPPHRSVMPQVASLVAAHQAEDGTWPHADLFHVLEALLAAGTVDARAAVRRAIPALLARQSDNGTFGPTAEAERALIGLRALLWSEE